jgi:hypothetical protein
MGPVESRTTFVINNVSSEKTIKASPNTDQQY